MGFSFSKLCVPLDGALGLLFQSSCLFCERRVNEAAVCGKCRWLIPVSSPFCDQCGYPTPDPISRCGECEERERKIVKVRSQYWLNEEAKQWMHRIKFGGEEGFLAKTLAGLHPGDCPFPQDAVLIPVPLSAGRWFKRYFNQSERLARWLSDHWRLRFEENFLVRLDEGAPQSTLARAERLSRRVRFAVDETRSISSPVILIDDIYTTGGTLEQAARAIKGKSAQAIYAWTLFRTERISGQAARSTDFEPRGLEPEDS